MSTSAATNAIAFGPFRLLPAQKLLLESGRPVRLGSRALEILIILSDRSGALVTKEELVARVWPNTFVDESNLKVHVAALRKVLGDGQAGNRYVINVPGRGYQFVASISRVEETSPPPLGDDAPSLRHNLPAPLNRIVGRSGVVESLLAQVSADRLVSIVGPGGIGKTTVALAVAHQLIGTYAHGIWFLDLAPVGDPALIASALASVLGVAVYSEDAVPSLISFLRDKRALIVLDSCEHVIEAAAILADALLKGCPNLQILATSREPLRGPGEHVQRLPPLDVPPTSAPLTADKALTFSAVQLFVERASACLDGFALNDQDAPIVSEICDRLDGNALAIELAAGRVDAFGVGGIGRRLDDRFRLLTSGRRTASPRHQALSAAIDWSYNLLPPAEKAVLRRLGVLVGGFTLEAASAVVVDENVGAADAVDAVVNLVGKSLISADVEGASARYRLLDTTRAYARDKIVESDDYSRIARRHADYYRILFDGASSEASKQTISDWVTLYGGHVDNVRAALDWAFSASGDETVGVLLTVATVPLWLSLSLMDECRWRVRRALDSAERGLEPATRDQMTLYAGLGVALYSIGPSPEATAAWTSALEIAQSLDDSDHRLRALWGLWTIGVTGGKQRPGLALAREFFALATKANDLVARLVADRMVGISLHFLGDNRKGRQHIERMLSASRGLDRRPHVVRFQFDQFVASTAYLARVLWIMGLPDQALRTAESSVTEARTLGHTNSLCYVLGSGACAVALLSGDLVVAERYVTTLLEQSQKHMLALWNIMGLCFSGSLDIMSGRAEAGLQTLRQGVDALRDAGFVLYHTAALAELAKGLGMTGRAPEGLNIIDRALEQARRNHERWCLSELLRIKGDLLLLQQGLQATVAAETLFLESLGWARRQEALSWELRTAVSLARLRMMERRNDEAHAAIAPVYGRFSEGFSTADLRSAKQLLSELGRGLQHG